MIYRVGYPNQDRRTTPISDMKWRPPIEKRCPVCLGMKVEQPKPNYPPPRTEIYHSTPFTDEERNDLSTTETIPMEAYDEES